MESGDFNCSKGGEFIFVSSDPDEGSDKITLLYQEKKPELIEF